MKTYFYLVFFYFSIINATAQSEEDLVAQTLMYYIDGTSYTHPDLLRKAFYEEAKLYFDKNGEPWLLPAEQYISWFEKSPPGTPTGRIGQILSIDRTENVATAKVEILVPENNLLFIDYFILKKHQGEWKIMSKTYTKSTTNKTGKRILFIVSNAHFYGDSELSSSNHFAEIILAYDVLAKAGYTIDFVSPEGGAIPIGYINSSQPITKQYLYNGEFMRMLSQTKTPDQIDAAQYKAVYYSGGGSAMFGVHSNKGIQQIVMQIYEQQNGIISSVCHGTAGIVNLKTSDGQYLVKGKQINGFPDMFEDKKAAYYAEFPFSIEETIKKRGGLFQYSSKGWDGYIQTDGRLITGQDPTSATLVAKQIVLTLEGLENKE